MMRIGHYRPVHVKSPDAQLTRPILQARRQIVASLLQVQGTIRGPVKTYGLKDGPNAAAAVQQSGFETWFRRCRPYRSRSGPSLQVLERLLEERHGLDLLWLRAARQDDVCLRLMTIPGVGPITSLAYRATLDDPARFASSRLSARASA